jgi:cytidine deaminase
MTGAVSLWRAGRFMAFTVFVAFKVSSFCPDLFVVLVEVEAEPCGICRGVLFDLVP